MRVALLVLGLPLAGCIEAASFIPKVNFDRMEVRDLTWTDVSTDFVFAVDNPNPVEVGVAEFAYAFDLEGVNLFEGDNADGFALAANGTSELVLPIDLVFAETWQAITAARGQDEVGFDLSGEMGFDTPVGRVKVPYDEAGAFPAVRTPRFRFNGIRLASIEIQGALLEVDVGVDNEHGSSLLFDRFAYGLRVEGFEVGQGLIDSFEVQGASEGVLTIPFEVRFSQVGMAVAQAIGQGGPLTLGIEADVDVQTPFGVLPLAVNESGDVVLP